MEALHCSSDEGAGGFVESAGWGLAMCYDGTGAGEGSKGVWQGIAGVVLSFCKLCWSCLDVNWLIVKEFRQVTGGPRPGLSAVRDAESYPTVGCFVADSASATETEGVMNRLS